MSQNWKENRIFPIIATLYWSKVPLENTDHVLVNYAIPACSYHPLLSMQGYFCKTGIKLTELSLNELGFLTKHLRFFPGLVANTPTTSSGASCGVRFMSTGWKKGRWVASWPCVGWGPTHSASTVATPIIDTCASRRTWGTAWAWVSLPRASTVILHSRCSHLQPANVRLIISRAYWSGLLPQRVNVPRESWTTGTLGFAQWAHLGLSQYSI